VGEGRNFASEKADGDRQRIKSRLACALGLRESPACAEMAAKSAAAKA
jgi:hypothetical protein